MNLFVYLIPALFVVVFIVAAIRKVKVYDSFAEGVKGAIPLVVSLFPFVAAVLILSQLFEASGLSDGLQSLRHRAPFGNFSKIRRGQLYRPLRLRRVRFERNGLLRGGGILCFGQGKKTRRPHRHSPMRQLHRARVRLFPMPFFLAGRKC